MHEDAGVGLAPAAWPLSSGVRLPAAQRARDWRDVTPERWRFEARTQVMGSRVQDGLRDVGRNWMLTLAVGILSVVAGLAVIFLPGPSLLVVAILVGAQLMVNAVFMFVSAFAIPRESGWLRALVALLAALSFVVGIYVIGHPLVGLLVLAVVLGVFWIF